jgi:hypothetical protein
MKGIWRPFETYAFVENRSQQNDIRRDGTYMLFKFPWENPSLVTNPALNSGYAKWRLANRITKYSPFGYEIENEDALNNFSSALYGYGNSLVTAVTANARYNEMLFDGFEDYSINNLCNDVHWSFTKTISPNSISTSEAHTGKSSFKILAGTSPVTETVEVPVGFVCSNSTSPNYSVTGVGVQLSGCGCNGRFQPEPGITGKDYIISLWVKQVLPPNFSSTVVTSYTLPRVTINFLDNLNSNVGQSVLTPQSSNKIIEGWQRMSEKIYVPPQATKMQLVFENNVQFYAGAF